MHDSVAFYKSFDNLLGHYNINDITYFVGDAAYITGHICKTLIDLDLIPCGKINKDGYQAYKAAPYDCSNCLLKEQCTKGKYK